MALSRIFLEPNSFFRAEVKVSTAPWVEAERRVFGAVFFTADRADIDNAAASFWVKL